MAAVKVMVEVPADCGVPEIEPLAVLIINPAGRPVALKLVGLLVAVIVYENALPTVPVALAGLLITGAGGGGGAEPMANARSS